MKRSHAKQKEEKKKAKDGHALTIATFVKAKADIARLEKESAEATANLSKSGKEVILANLDCISPFRDAFLHEIGTIVDFSLPAKDGDVHRMLLRGYDNQYMLVEHAPGFPNDLALTELPQEEYDTVQDANEDMDPDEAHDFTNGSWDECPCSDTDGDVNACSCKVWYSDIRDCMNFVESHFHSVIALMHELVALHRKFMSNPEHTYAKITKAAEKRSQKKHKKDKKEEDDRAKK